MRKIPNSKKYTLQLDTASLETIQKFAAAKGIARNELIRAALRKFAATLETRTTTPPIPIQDQIEAEVNLGL